MCVCVEVMSGVSLVRWERQGASEEDRVELLAGTENADESSVSIVQNDFHDDSETTANNTVQIADKQKKKNAKTPLIVYVISFFSIIGGFLFGYDTGVIAGALLELDKDFPLDTTKKELVVSVTVAAAAIGAIAGGPLNEMAGRKKTIMVASVIFAVGAVLMASAPLTGWGWYIVLIGRFIVGLGIGMASMTVPMYLAECAPVHLRGRLTVADNMAVTGGQFAAGIIDYAFSYTAQGWRYMFGLAAIPAVVRFIAFFFLPESPRWLVGKGRVEAAQRVLGRLRGGGSDDEVEKELSEIRDDLEQSAENNSKNIFRKLKVILTTRHLLLALTVGCGLQAIQQLSGINTVMYYSPTVLRMAGVVNNHTAIGLGAVIAFGNFIFTLVGLYLVEKSGRRKLILASLAGVVVSLTVLGLAFYLANTSSPPAFAPADLYSNDSECFPYNRSCAAWRNCDDCVVADECHYCAFNGSFNSEHTIGLCVSSDDRYLYSGGQCSTPESLTINYTTNGDCSSMDVQNGTVKTFQYCPSSYAWLTMVALVMYIVSFAPGMGPVPWTVNAEIYPNWARSIGCSIATTANWLSNLLVSVSFLHLTQYLTRYGAFWLYTGIASAGWLFIFLLLPETKGKALEQVEELFQRPLCPPPGFNSSSDGRCCRRNSRTYSVLDLGRSSPETELSEQA